MKTDNRQANVKRIYSDIKKAILAGRMHAGEKLPELTLCEEYGASRLHVKEALKMLEMEMLVLYKPRKGYSVASVSLTTIQDVAAMRYALECIVCEYFSKYAKPEVVEDLKRSADRLKLFGELRRHADVLDESVRYYHIIYQTCPFERIIGALQSLDGYIDYVKKYDADEEGYFERGTYGIVTLTEGIVEKNFAKIRHALYYRNHKVLNTIFDLEHTGEEFI